MEDMNRHRLRVLPSIRLSSLTLLVLLLGVAPAWLVPTPVDAQLIPQIEEEELEEEPDAPPPPAPAEERPPAGITDELRQRFEEAEEVFHSADQPASLALFSGLVDLLEARRLTRGLDEEARSLLEQSLSYRAQVHFNLGETALVREDLGQLLQVNPDADLDRDLVSPKLVDQFDAIRRQTIGEIDFVLEPPDAEVRVDDRPVEALAGPVGVLAGEHEVEIARPGYAPQTRVLQVDAGSTTTVEAQLERTSPVLRLHTRPKDAEVFLDGELVGVTTGEAPEGYLPEGAGAIYRREEFSSELVVDEIEPGRYLLEVRREGYRAYRNDVALLELLDYRMPPIVLEPESGRLAFQGLPRGAEVRVNGDPVRLETPGSSRPTLSLPPGEYAVTVTDGPSRMYSTRIELADRQTMEIRVQLRPGLVFLGVWGADAATRGDLVRSLRKTFADAGHWTLVDRSADGPEILRDRGVDAPSLRAALRGGPEGPRIGWRAVQSTLDAEAPGLVYLLAVLENDLLASEASLLVLPSAPGPAEPDHLRIAVGDRVAYEELAATFDRGVPLHRPWLGALLVDSLAVPHPVVAEVTPSGPADKAGLRVGDQVLGFRGNPIQTRRQLEERLLVSESGETVDVAVRGAEGARNLSLELGRSPWIVAGRDAGLVDALAWARLVLLEDTVGGDERWIVRLDQALLQLQAGDAEGAVRRLRDLRAPQRSHGVSQATVDYWLGIALSRLGPRFRDAAREALERATRIPGARLDHDDDAWVAPRAEARLHALSLGG